MSQLPIRPFNKDTDRPLAEAFFTQMGGESRGFFNRGGGNEQNALRFFTPEGLSDSAYFLAEDQGRMAGYVFLWDLHKSIPWLASLWRRTGRGNIWAGS